VVKSGVNTLIWAGDADVVCDWMGNLAVAEAVAYPDSHVFKYKEVKNYTVNGVVAGTYKTEGRLNWLRVFESGHFVSYYRKLGVRRESAGLTESRAGIGLASFQAGNGGETDSFDLIPPAMSAICNTREITGMHRQN
jgi:hypothetical protein